MGTLVPAFNATRSLQSSQKTGHGEDGSVIHTVAIILGLLTKVLGLLILFGFLIVTGLVWFWLASFRAGWRFGNWLEQQPNNQDKLVLNALYGSIVALFSPLAILGDWSQELIAEKFQIQFPPKINLRQIVERQLGIKLPENTPCLPEKTSPTNNPTLPGGSK